jgi:four helix bundle protein
MAFDALEVAIQLCAALRPLMVILRQYDPELEKQTRRAANGIALQLAESRRRAGKDRVHLGRVAAGSTDEVCTALRLTQAWGYLHAESLKHPFELLDRLQAMCWRLTH